MISYYMLIIVVLYCFRVLSPSQVPAGIFILALLSIFINILGIALNHFFVYDDDSNEDNKDNDN